MDNPARRQLLKFLAASPLLYCTAAGRLLAEESLDAIELPDHLIKSPADALDVFDFHAVAKHNLPPAHYGYLATGTDGNETLSANRRAFEQVYLRPQRMVNTSRISLETTLLGESLQSPIVLAPVGSQGAFHPDAEIATVRAARAQGHLQILSNVTSNPIEAVIATRGEPVWFQLYPTNQWSTAQTMLERAERAGVRVVVLTVDLNSASNRVLLGQHERFDDRDCSTCHGTDSVEDFLRMNPMYEGSRVTYADFGTPDMTWDYPQPGSRGDLDEDRGQGHRHARGCGRRSGGRGRRGLRLQPRRPRRGQRLGHAREPARGGLTTLRSRPARAGCTTPYLNRSACASTANRSATAPTCSATSQWWRGFNGAQASQSA